MNNNILSMIGMATKAGKTVSGEFSVEKAIREGKAELIIVSEEASDNTKKLFTNKSKYYHIPLKIYGSMEELGKATGNNSRASVAITDTGFSNSLIIKLKDIGK
ncbi:MAG: L7Ae/L30e/S12e/Gadd45 family ribosomal protein [Eubacterium sp.]